MPSETVDLQRRARILLETLNQKKTQIIVPTVVVAELLSGIPVKGHGRFIAELQKRFFCPPLDIRASALAAELWQKYKAQPFEEPYRRDTLKADVLIVATAKAAGATAFYSHDKNGRKLAELAGMNAHDLPTHSEDMFVDLEARQRITEEE